jgi:hypothetical protein
MSLTTIAAQLGKMIPRLGSNHDGEVVATARAIERALRGAGHDWHDLVKGLHLSALRDWRDDLACCAENMGYFDDRERYFLRSMAHWRGRPTQKQLDWLGALADRVRGAA